MPTAVLRIGHYFFNAIMLWRHTDRRIYYVREEWRACTRTLLKPMLKKNIFRKLSAYYHNPLIPQRTTQLCAAEEYVDLGTVH